MRFEIAMAAVATAALLDGSDSFVLHEDGAQCFFPAPFQKPYVVSLSTGLSRRQDIFGITVMRELTESRRYLATIVLL